MQKKNPCGTFDRPQASYRERFYHKLISKNPGSVLDVGCGSGDLMRRLADDHIRAVGIETDQKMVDGLVKSGLSVQTGRAEDLPFEDNEFDLVVSEFSAHHFEDLGKTLSEGLRVARTGIAILDQWYDVAIPSQAVARRFDKWCKKIDTDCGLIHNPNFTPSDFYGLLEGQDQKFQIEILTDFIAVPLSFDKMQSDADEQLAKLSEPSEAKTEFETILDQARKTGISDDGAIIIFVMKSLTD